MNDNINLDGTSLAAFLDRIGLPPVARDRVIEIDQILAGQLASDEPDADGCAALAVEAADLTADRDPAGFDWSGWDDNEFVGSDGWDNDFAERMFDLSARAGGDSDWGEGGIE